MSFKHGGKRKEKHQPKVFSSSFISIHLFFLQMRGPKRAQGCGWQSTMHNSVWCLSLSIDHLDMDGYGTFVIFNQRIKFQVYDFLFLSLKKFPRSRALFFVGELFVIVGSCLYHFQGFLSKGFLLPHFEDVFSILFDLVPICDLLPLRSYDIAFSNLVMQIRHSLYQIWHSFIRSGVLWNLFADLESLIYGDFFCGLFSSSLLKTAYYRVVVL